MSDYGNIKYLSHQQIDKEKWNACIKNSSNGLIYAFSFYLDTMAKQWDALVLNDYEAVMPLTYNKKYGIKYLYQPFLTAQLGIFGNNLSETIIDSFIQSIPASFRFIDILLNSNNISGHLTGLSIPRNNYVLDLNKSYDSLYQNYKENIQRNIKKAQQAGCSVQKDFDAEKVIKLAVLQMKGQGQEEKKNIDHFRQLYQYLHSKQMATTYGIFSAENELVASCIFFFSHNRAYYIVVGNHPNGRNLGASHALIDAFIKDHAGKNMLLDFEGSDIPNLALFYSSFGAVNEIYPALKINRLPFYLKWLKG
jgi:lipid II:glycine glycyltransferase (peptidoglycan interpeptide bridge formation enzyme)